MATTLLSTKLFKSFFIVFPVAFLLSSLLFPNTVVHATSFTVNSVDDEADINPGDGLCETETQGECTLRASIMEANSLIGSDLIYVPNGIYFLSFEHNPDQYDLEISDNLTIIGENADSTIIDGNNLDRVFHIIGDINVLFNNLTMQHGLTLGWDGSVLGYGGGIASDGGDLVLQHCIIRENTAEHGGGGIFIGIGGNLDLSNVTITSNSSGFGGGISNIGGELVISESTVHNNSSIQEGGGLSNQPEYLDYIFTKSIIIDSIFSNNNSGYQGGGIYNYNYSNMEIINSTFVDNIASQEGGGIFNAGDMKVNNSIVSGNISPNGGGLFNNRILDVNNTSINSNSALGDFNNGFGGGISNQIGGDMTGTVTLNNVYITSNGANYGGGIANRGYISILDSTIDSNWTNPSDGGGLWNYADSVAQVNNSIFVNNFSGDRGGAIYNWGETEAINSTFFGNRASQGGHGIHNIGGASTISYSTFFDNTDASYGDRATIQIVSGSVLFQNSIISNNNNLATFNCDLGVIDGGHNIDTGSTCGFETANNSMSNTNPLLASLMNNGGVTQTLALLPNSPAIDAGNNTNCPTTDQRGVLRPLDGNGDTIDICDIGAYENESIQTTSRVLLLDSQYNGLAGATVQYYANGWQNIPGSTDVNGILSFEDLGLSGNVVFRITYANASIQKQQNITDDPIVQFQTESVRIQFLASDGSTELSGNAQYYSNGWHTFGNGYTNTNMELLPLTYTFRVAYGGASIQKQQNIDNDSNVLFQTKSVTMQLLASDGLTELIGAGDYYASGWKAFGNNSTSSTMELLPVSYTFRVSYGGANIQKQQNINTDSYVVFQTKLVTMKLLASDEMTELIGVGQYYASGWKNFSNNSTTTSIELLPTNYTFRISFRGASVQKQQDINTNPLVIFQTGQVYSISNTATQYYANGWKIFVQNMELLPTSYAFRFSDGTAQTMYALIAGITTVIH